MMLEKKSTTESRQRIGSLLVEAGRISREDVESILAAQMVKGLRFGDIGRAMGLLTDEDLHFALALQFNYLHSKDGGVWIQRWMQLVEKIERVPSIDYKHQLLEQLSRPARPFVLAFANAHAMNSLASSSPFFESLHAADMVLRDGSGMATLFELLQLKPGLNLNGTDLIPDLIPKFNGRCIALFGTKNPYLERGLQVVAKQFAPQSQYVSETGFMEVENYVALALLHRPALIVLGMGMPKQEEVASALRAALSFPCLIICGGAIIDFLGGKTPRCPLWMRKMGMEWLFRLAMEPRRLFQRYIIGNPLFLMRAVHLKYSSRR